MFELLLRAKAGRRYHLLDSINGNAAGSVFLPAVALPPEIDDLVP
ncbi:MAG: hypothetical protein AB7T74_14460 [Clostridia bacterium]|nr:hypothetical protein [Spirochaetia bacterium]